MPTDTELLLRYCDGGDEMAFAALVQRHLELVYNAALRRVNGNSHLADEAAQITFTQLARKARTVSRHPSVAAWLHTSTRFAASSLLRREARRAARELSAAAMPANADDPPWDTLRPWIDDALDQLRPDDRQALLLRFFAGRSYAEIGVELALSEEAARKRVERSLEQLRQRFVRRGISTSVAALSTALAQAPIVAAPTASAAAIAAKATTDAGVGSTLLASIAAVKLSSLSVTALSVAGLGLFVGAMANWTVNQRADAQQLATLAAQTDRYAARNRAALAHPGDTSGNALPARAGTEAAPARRAPDPASEQLALMRFRLQDPAFAPFRREETRLRVQQEFEVFFRARNYSRAELSAAQQALVECYEAIEADQYSILIRPPDAPPVPLPNRMDEMLAKLRPVLGDDRTGELRRCFLAQNFLPAAQNVSLDLADAGESLSPAEQLALAMVVADGNTPLADRVARVQRDQVDGESGLTAGERAQLEDAAAFLSGKQLAAFEAYLREMRLRNVLTGRALESTKPHS